MANYVRTGPFSAGVGPGISAAFLNNVENVLEQPSGSTETGSYYITGNGNSNASFGAWFPSLSRTATPVSVSIDESITAHSLCGVATANFLDANGFHVFSQTTATTLFANVGGHYTIHY